MEVQKWQLSEYIRSAKNDGWKFTRESSNPKQDWYEAEVVVIHVGQFKLLAYTNKYANDKTSSFLNLWGPDRLVVEPHLPYVRPSKEDLRICPVCGQAQVDTYQYSFAGRCCKDCLPEMRRMNEPEGWTR